MSTLDKYTLYDFTPESHEGQEVIHVMPCFSCGKVSIMILNKTDYNSWKTKVYVQQAFPYLTASQREMVINGMHPECFDKLFPE